MVLYFLYQMNTVVVLQKLCKRNVNPLYFPPRFHVKSFFLGSPGALVSQRDQ